MNVSTYGVSSLLPWNLVSFQVHQLKESVLFFRLLLLACLPRQRDYVTGNSMCPSLPFDIEHQERFHHTTKIWTAFKGRPLSCACCFAYMTVTHSDTHAIYTHMLSYTYTSIQRWSCVTTKWNWKPSKNGYFYVHIHADARCIVWMKKRSLKLLLVMEMSRTNLHFACVVPPITAPDDDGRPHLKKALERGFYAWGQIQAQVGAYEKLIMMPKKKFWFHFLQFPVREINTPP